MTDAAQTLLASLRPPGADAAADLFRRREAASVLAYLLFGAGLFVIARTRAMDRVSANLDRRVPAGLLGLATSILFIGLLLALGRLASAAGLLTGAGPGAGVHASISSFVAESLAGGLVLEGALTFLRRAGPVGGAAAALLCALLLFSAFAFGPLLIAGALRGDRPAPASLEAGRILAFAERGGLRPDALFLTAPGKGAASVDAEGAFGVSHVAVGEAALVRPQAETFAALGHLLGHLARWDYVGLGFFAGSSVLVLAAALAFGAPRLARGLLGSNPPRALAPGALPVLALVVWALFPFGRAAFDLYDQHINYRADAFALRLTGDPAALIRWAAAGEGALPQDPGVLESLFFYDHPPLAPRVRRILQGSGGAFNGTFAGTR